MAVMKHTGDRRAFLAAGMGTIVAVGAAPATFAVGIAAPNPHTAWDRAMAAYTHAKRQMDILPGDAPVAAFCDAESAILATSAPDIKAVHWKVERLREIADHSVIESKDLEQLSADIARLLGDV